MSHIKKISIDNYRGIKHLEHEFGDEKFVILIGRGDSGKTTILSAIKAVLSPSWNLSFSDLDFYKQDLSAPIRITVEISQLPQEILKENKYGGYTKPLSDEEFSRDKLSIQISLTVDEYLEPHWYVLGNQELNIPDKPISANDRALLAVDMISDYTDNQFAYNRQSSLYSLTKVALEEGLTVERVKSQLIRNMNNGADESCLLPLHNPLKELKVKAQKLGLGIEDLGAQLDIKENPYTGNSIALHEAGLPFRLHGKGSKRIMSIAIQSELTNQGGIVLIDEIEQGLEPDRIVTLVRLFKSAQHGQVFITTHSVNVIMEANWHNITLVQKNDNEVSLFSLSNDLEDCRRTNPHAFFAKRVICCEGKTEVGFMRKFDQWLWETKGENMSSLGIALITCGGGDKMYSLAQKFKSYGYDTCVFADDDNSKQLKKQKEMCQNLQIPLFLCEEGKCLEAQIIGDLPWELLKIIVDCPQEDFPSANIIFPEDKRLSLDSLPSSPIEEISMRDLIFSLCVDKEAEEKTDKKGRAIKKKEWFKHIPGGEFLGSLVVENMKELEGKHLHKLINGLSNWCLCTPQNK